MQTVVIGYGLQKHYETFSRSWVVVKTIFNFVKSKIIKKGKGEEEKELKYDNLSPEELEEVCEVFDIFDKNKDETIEVSAFGTVLRWLGYNPTDTELKNW